MNNDLIFNLVVADLNLINPPTQIQLYLNSLISASIAEIGREGIVLNDSIDDMQTVAMYTCYLYRKRAMNENGMPRMLRYRLNNRLFSQKASEAV